MSIDIKAQNSPERSTQKIKINGYLLVNAENILGNKEHKERINTSARLDITTGSVPNPNGHYIENVLISKVNFYITIKQCRLFVLRFLSL